MAALAVAAILGPACHPDSKEPDYAGIGSSAGTGPSVTLVLPVDGSVFTAPAEILLEAVAGDADGRVVRVDFFEGDRMIGTATEEPYVLTWGPVVEGAYTLAAVATDDSGFQTISPPISIRVAAPTAP